MATEEEEPTPALIQRCQAVAKSRLRREGENRSLKAATSQRCRPTVGRDLSSAYKQLFEILGCQGFALLHA